MSKVSIILLIYNGERFLEKCLEAVYRQSYRNIELIVIDNASHDDSVKIVERKFLENQDFSKWLIKNKKNIGFAGGQNLGIKEAKGDFILCLNQDVILADDYIDKIVAFISQKKDKIGAIQGKLLKLDKNLDKTETIDSAGLVIFKNRRIINRAQGEKDVGKYDLTQEIFGTDGAAPIFNKQALEEIKIRRPDGDWEYFDEDFFAYKEDVDISWRLRLCGWKIFYLPQAKAWHERGSGESAAKNYVSIIKERIKINRTAKYLSFRNQRLMQIKNEDPINLLINFPWIIFKEVGAWLYVLFFERYTLKTVGQLFKMAPAAFKKRKTIMSKRIVSAREIRKFFQ